MEAVYLGKNIGNIDPETWGAVEESEFLDRFKGLYPLNLLKEAYKAFPKPKKEVKKSGRHIQDSQSDK